MKNLIFFVQAGLGLSSGWLAWSRVVVREAIGAPFHLVAQAGFGCFFKSQTLIEAKSSLASEDAQPERLLGGSGFAQEALNQGRAYAVATVGGQQGNIHQAKLVVCAVDNDVSNGLSGHQDDCELGARKGGLIASLAGVKLHLHKGLPRGGGPT
jgi:hypothetical protein